MVGSSNGQQGACPQTVLASLQNALWLFFDSKDDGKDGLVVANKMEAITYRLISVLTNLGYIEGEHRRIDLPLLNTSTKISFGQYLSLLRSEIFSESVFRAVSVRLTSLLGCQYELEADVYDLVWKASDIFTEKSNKRCAVAFDVGSAPEFEAKFLLFKLFCSAARLTFGHTERVYECSISSSQATFITQRILANLSAVVKPSAIERSAENLCLKQFVADFETERSTLLGSAEVEEIEGKGVLDAIRQVHDHLLLDVIFHDSVGWSSDVIHGGSVRQAVCTVQPHMITLRDLRDSRETHYFSLTSNSTKMSRDETHVVVSRIDSLQLYAARRQVGAMAKIRRGIRRTRVSIGRKISGSAGGVAIGGGGGQPDGATDSRGGFTLELANLRYGADEDVALSLYMEEARTALRLAIALSEAADFVQANLDLNDEAAATEIQFVPIHRLGKQLLDSYANISATIIRREDVMNELKYEGSEQDVDGARVVGRLRASTAMAEDVKPNRK